MKIYIVEGSQVGPVNGRLAIAELTLAAKALSGSIVSSIDEADTIILLGEGEPASVNLSGHKVTRVSHLNDVFADAKKVLTEAQAKAVEYQASESKATQAEAQSGNKFIIGITSCPTGVAHTYMAQEALEKAARALGYEYKIETQGSVGAQNVLTPADIERADVVIIAADTNVALDRFNGKKLYKTNTKDPIHNGTKLIDKALAESSIFQATGSSANKESEKESKGTIGDIYKHLMTGVSYMLPFVVAGGLLIALGFAFGGLFVFDNAQRDSFAAYLFWSGKVAFELFVPILGAYIAYSIAGRPGLAPGMVGGYIATHPYFGWSGAVPDDANAGFLGAIIAGFLAGYIVKWINQLVKLPKSLDSLKPMVILPLFGTGLVGLLMFGVISEPVAFIFKALTNWLQAMNGTNAVLLGAIVGGMMAVDMGGPVNKAAYLFGTALVGSNVSEIATMGYNGPMAAVMAGGMVPPLAIFFATLFYKNKFIEEDRQAGKACGILGFCFITEGAIPFAAKDPVRIIPVMVVGAAIAGALSMMFKVTSMAPHGGLLDIFIPNVIGNPLLYVVAILIGTLISAFLVGLVKKKVN